MTKFNPENKETLTYGECLEPAMKITDPEDARQYMAEYVKFIAKHDCGKNTPEEVAKQNLGYYAGYYDNETRMRVEMLFTCAHPVLGSIKQNGIPTSLEAFECGKTNSTLSEIRNQ